MGVVPVWVWSRVYTTGSVLGTVEVVDEDAVSMTTTFDPSPPPGTLSMTTISGGGRGGGG